MLPAAQGVTFHATFSDGAGLLPFGRAKRQQLRRALLLSLNLPSYSADRILLAKVAGSTAPAPSVTLRVTLLPSPSVTLDQLSAAAGNLLLFLRSGTPAIKRWFKGEGWRGAAAGWRGAAWTGARVGACGGLALA